MKLESLVIADQHAAVNTFSGLVHTARHTMRAGNTRSRWPNRKEGAVEGRASDWGQVVTRYPYENVGMDHLLSKEKEKYKTFEVHECVYLFSFEGAFLGTKEETSGKFFEN